MPTATFHVQSLTQLIEKRAREQPDQNAVYTAPPPTNDEDKDKIVLQSLTYSQLSRAVDRIAAHYTSCGVHVPTDASPNTDDAAASKNQTPVAAVLVSSAIDESILEIALAKAGLAALLLSINNSAAAVAHLCKLTNARWLIYGPRFERVAAEAKAIRNDNGADILLVPETRYPLWGPGGVDDVKIPPFKAAFTPEQEMNRTAVILHSSGSTGFPKPVYISHYGLVANIAISRNKPGFSSLPVYHGFGHFSFFRCVYAAKEFVLFPPHLPLTSSNIVRSIKAAPDTRECVAVPYVIKLLAETEEGTRALASFDVVSFAGAALPDDLGNRLTAAGVNLLSIYGTTETGSLMGSNRDFATDKAWNWVRPLSGSKDYLRFEKQEGQDNLFECVVCDGYPPKLETNRPDGAYATKDLFVRHPEHPDWYKYFGRLDDTLVHTLGEKTNPLSMEQTIRGNSIYVQEAIVFGAGRPLCGVLILPSEAGKDMSPDELTDVVWPVIEQANREAPSHSRIIKEMVGVLPYGTEVPVATKMSILRPACYAKFKDVIDDIYNNFESNSRLPKLAIQESAEMKTFIRETLESVLGKVAAGELSDDSDFFSAGVDSLAASRIRNVCAVRLELGSRTLGQNIVYEYPSINKLAVHLLSVVNNTSEETAASKAANDEHERMLAMLERWSNNVITRQSQSELAADASEAVIVLTGATGSLGAHILFQLLQSPKVGRVICLSRAAGHAESLERLKESLVTRRLTVKESDWERVSSFSADVTKEWLGLKKEEWKWIKEELTGVIHNAWPVNFSWSLDSFESQIEGVTNLMNLCLLSPHKTTPAFYYSSSISARQGSPDETCMEEYSPSPATAGATGYARSKWVVEKLCERASQKGLPVGVLRIGQMVGDTAHGVWQPTEALPLLFKSAQVLQVLPTVDESPSWLPVDVAGSAIAELVLREKQPSSEVYHICNPDNSVHWDQILAHLKEAGLKFDVVNRHTWVEKLELSEQDVRANPTYKLLPYYRGRYGREVLRKPMYFFTDKTVKEAPSLGKSLKLDQNLVAKWVSHWKEIGFLA